MWAREAKRNGPRELGFEREENSRKSAVNRGLGTFRVDLLGRGTTAQNCYGQGVHFEAVCGTIWENGKFLGHSYLL